MKNTKSPVRLFPLTSAALISLAPALAPFASADVYSEDFEASYSAGNLLGQNSWASGYGVSPTPSSAVIDESSEFYISSSVGNSYSILDAGNFGLSDSDTITLTFDLRVTAASANAAFGIGEYDQTSSNNGNPPTLGIQGGNWTLRGWGFGTSALARDGAGSVITADVNDWYRVRSTWDLSGAGTGTLEIMNLTEGETSFTQLYFDSAQTVSSASLELDNVNADDVDTWSGVFVRLNNGQVDNISVIPEPATAASLVGLFALLGAVGARRFHRA